ncbi:ring-1,2-phenylacetyl-CoA epoxidase subunit PaaC [Paracoccus isoporae]|uniref:Ring-1,2-phenylacetyl-CoA epoxidase subunit PaaC n=1 Tax=Paracoccus isoporae TaxID=591205 RepID=A0A1G7ARE9_9RHOB|nr:1,2-phenylacetyl-CoA epoxidase subunit PaaC [Paracoccus isoporae]SDE17270.1 ring-1,2-phenylacetyl-CoA epoxidase subunit PaaC [Paracoccus isoporae]
MPSLPDIMTPNAAELAKQDGGAGGHAPAPDADQDALVEFLLRMGDNALILGHRNSEWCGHGPQLEEDIAVSNIALDLIGQAAMWLELAGAVEGQGRSADDLAYLRDVWDFRNVKLVERPNGDFGATLMRQFLFDAFHFHQLRGLVASSDARVSEIAAKALKEVSYHLERSAGQVIALGDGTGESRGRMQAALEDQWSYALELFASDGTDRNMAEAGIAPDPAELRGLWDETVGAVMAEATLEIPDSDFAHQGGKQGTHTEHLGYILAEMQFLQRAYPGAEW